MDLSLMQDEELVRLSRSDSKAMDYLLNKNFLYTESPIRIISQYITDNFLQNLKNRK